MPIEDQTKPTNKRKSSKPKKRKPMKEKIFGPYIKYARMLRNFEPMIFPPEGLS